jgi:hypothetical protein
MALKDIVSQKDLIAERDRNQANEKAELKRANYAKERSVGNNIAYRQFKRSGTEGIDTEPDLIDRLMGASKDDAKYQSAKEMKKALESERARVNVSDELDAKRKAMYDSAKKDDMGLPAGARTYKKGGMVKSSASKRADGIATKGKTRGKIC